RVPTSGRLFPSRRSSDLDQLGVQAGEFSSRQPGALWRPVGVTAQEQRLLVLVGQERVAHGRDFNIQGLQALDEGVVQVGGALIRDRKSTRLNSSHVKISY